MSNPECAHINYIWNDKLRKGFCVGVSQNTRSYSRDVVRLCWVKHKPTPNMRCITEMQVQLTPEEAGAISLALGGAHLVGTGMLLKQKTLEKEAKKKDESESNNS